jgi:LysR family nitrogen assimilation transcriptional regulator
LDLRELRYFVQVAELKSFSRAAIHLRIAQPALSRQVRKLEDELGLELLIRSGRGLELTEAGAQLLRRAYSVLEQVDDIKVSLKAQGNPISGTLVLGVPPAAGEMLVPPVIERCENLYPNLQIDVVEGFSGFLYERLLNHDLSMAVIHNPATHRDLKILPLLVEDMYLVGPAKPTRGLVPARELDNVQDLPLILPNRPHSLRLLVESALAEQGMPLNLKQQVDGLVLIRAMLRASLGYSVLTYGSVHRDIQAGYLSARLLKRPRIAWRMCLVKRNDTHRARAVDAVSAVLRSEVHRLVDSGIWRGNPQYSPEEAEIPLEA